MTIHNGSEPYRASGNMICAGCSREYWRHGHDMTELSFDNQPFLRLLCNGDRVKL